MADPQQSNLDELGGTGCPKLSIERKGTTGQRIVKIPEAYLADFLVQVMPDPYLVGTGLIRTPSSVWPGLPGVIVHKVDIEPWDPNSPIGDGTFPARYADWKVTVNYKTVEHDEKNNQNKDGPAGGKSPDNQAFMTHRVEIGGEFLTFPNSGLQWQGAADPTVANPTPQMVAVGDDTHVGIVIPTLEHSINWAHVPFPPWQTIRQAIGKVNSLSFAGAPPETALFLGVSASRELTYGQLRTWNLTYKFSEKNNNPLVPTNPYGWNHFLRPDGLSSGQWMRIKRKTPGGVSYLGIAAQAGDTTITVGSQNTIGSMGPTPIKAVSGFPSSGAFIIQIDNEQMKVTAVASGNVWTVTRGWNQTGAAGHTKGAAVQQLQATSLAGGMGINDGQMTVNDSAGFPTSGQFNVQVDQEIMSVILNPGGNPSTWLVLRGVSGTFPAAHSVFANVVQVQAPVYDLYDHNLLLLSGLIVG